MTALGAVGAFLIACLGGTAWWVWLRRTPDPWAAPARRATLRRAAAAVWRQTYPMPGKDWRKQLLTAVAALVSIALWVVILAGAMWLAHGAPDPSVAPVGPMTETP